MRVRTTTRRKVAPPLDGFNPESSRLQGFKPDAADTNSRPWYMGRYMLFSDQDLTALKHNLVGQALISTVFVGLLTIISNPAIPLLFRMVMMAGMITGLHASTIALYNLVVSHVQLHPKHNPKSWVASLQDRPGAAIMLGMAIMLVVVFWVSAAEPQKAVVNTYSVLTAVHK